MKFSCIKKQGTCADAGTEKRRRAGRAGQPAAGFSPAVCARRCHHIIRQFTGSRPGRTAGLLLVVLLVNLIAVSCGLKSGEELELTEAAVQLRGPEGTGSGEETGAGGGAASGGYAARAQDENAASGGQTMQAQDTAGGVQMTVQAQDAASGSLSGAETTGAVQNRDAGGQTAESPGIICVFVCGAVMREGVYTLPEGARIYEAVEAAGGFASDADSSYLNQALLLADQQQIRIPTKEESAAWREAGIAGYGGGTPEGSLSGGAEAVGGVQPGARGNAAGSTAGVVGAAGTGAGAVDAAGAAAQDGKININTASAQQLCTLPGIGETRAQAILSYRQEHGSFARTEDIMRVSGIKEGMYEKLAPFITVQ